MNKFKKIRYELLFMLIDKVSGIIYTIRTNHLHSINTKLDKAAGYYWEQLEDAKIKNSE